MLLGVLIYRTGFNPVNFMKRRASLNSVYKVSKDIVVRKVKGEIIIIPLSAESSDTENQLYTLNPTGKAVWKKLDGRKSLKNLIAELAAEFDSPTKEIEKDVIGIVGKLLKKGMIVE